MDYQELTLDEQKRIFKERLKGLEQAHFLINIELTMNPEGLNREKALERLAIAERGLVAARLEFDKRFSAQPTLGQI
jgi:hypothetical protein